LPIVLFVAILKHRLFGIDARLRMVINRSSLVGIYGGVFLVIEQLVQNATSAKYGILAGGLAAGLLLLGLRPLERLGQRIARAAVPGSTAMSKVPEPERIRFYQEQAEIAWSDGVLGRRERLLLDRLREGLGIEAAAAVDIEHRAAQHAMTPSPQVGRSKTPEGAI
jgi:hypothetical protein